MPGFLPPLRPQAVGHWGRRAGDPSLLAREAQGTGRPSPLTPLPGSHPTHLAMHTVERRTKEDGGRVGIQRLPENREGRTGLQGAGQRAGMQESPALHGMLPGKRDTARLRQQAAEDAGQTDAPYSAATDAGLEGS